MSSSSVARIKEECDHFCRVRGIKDPEQKSRLIKLALRSYHNLPAKEKQNWTLEDIMKQGL